jgi:cytochrome c2
MRSRSVPGSLWWLMALVALAIAAAAAGGAVLYYQARSAAKIQAQAITLGDVTRGEAAMARYGCAGCHAIPEISGANGQVGPDLAEVSQRSTIAGSLANDPETMVRWLMHPQALIPGSGMPEQGMTERDARDIAAYLYAES